MNLTLSLPLFDLLWAQLWQVSLLILFIAVLHRSFAKDRPHLAHVLWVLVLLKCVTPPIVGSPASPFSWLEGRSLASVELDDSGKPELRQSDLLARRNTKRPTSVSSDSIEVRAEHVSHSEFALNSNVRKSFDSNVSESNAIEKPNPTMDPSLKSNSWSLGFLNLGVICWLTGMLISFCSASLRWLAFRRWIGRSQVVEAPNATQVAQRLSTQLGIKRPIQLLVLECPVGPAVIGLLRPTILLPAAMVKGKSAADLEPILAHEMIHVRRGDLGWALLQTISKSLFWFNPLVWWASAMVTRESERSCDEETVASLACSPRHYANSLIDVLELKHRLRVAPAVPGVRPIDITSARLERVMKLGNGCQRRTPIWMWAVFIIGCCVALPGASFAWSQQSEETSEETKPVEQELKRLGSELSDLTNVPEPDLNSIKSTTTQDHPDEVQYFPAGPEFKLSREPSALVQENDHSREESGQTLPLEYFLSNLFHHQPTTSQQQDSGDAAIEREVEREVGDVLELVEQRGMDRSRAIACLLRELTEDRFIRGMNIEGTKLKFYATDKITEQIDSTLKRWREFGLDSVILETRFVTIRRDTVDELGLEWRFGEVAEVAPANLTIGKYQLDAVHLAGQLEDSAANPIAAATAFSSGNRLTMIALANDDQLKEMMDRWKGDATSSLRQMATVFTHSGQEATIRFGAEHPFVVGMKKIDNELPLNKGNLQPIVQLVNDGVSVEQFPVVNHEDGSVQVILNIETAEILDVDVVEMPIGDGITVQQPKIDRSSVLSDVTIPRDKKNAVICYFDKNSKGEEVAKLVIVTARVMTFEAKNLTPVQDVLSDDGADGKIYSHPLPVVQNSTRPDLSKNLEVYSLPDFFISGAENNVDNSERHQNIQQWMKNFDFRVKVSGNVDFELNEGENEGVIRGNHLEFKSGDGETLAFSGEQGVVRLQTRLGKPKKFEFDFGGSTLAKIYGSEISAESGHYHVEIIDEEEVSEWRFSGNVKAVVEGVTLSCDALQFSDRNGEARFQLSGNAKLVQEKADGESFSLSGEGIDWDVKNNRFQSHAAGEASRSRYR